MEEDVGVTASTTFAAIDPGIAILLLVPVVLGSAHDF
jgi:hypothetical protein